MARVYLIAQFVVLLLAGSAFAGQAIVKTIPLSSPLSLDGLLVASDGTLYGTEGYDGTRIFTIAPDGAHTIFSAGLNGPITLDYDNDGIFYVSTFNNRGLYKVDPEGGAVRFATVDPGPSGVILDRATGEVFVSHYGAGARGNGLTVCGVDIFGTKRIVVQGNGLLAPVSLAIDPEGNLYTANIVDAKVFKITPQGEMTLLTTLPVSTVVSPPFNIGHLVYAKGYLYVTGNYGMPHVYRVALDGSYEILAGSGEIGTQDGAALEATFDAPNGIAASITGDTLYVSELNNPAALRMIILQGTTDAGRGDMLPGGFEVERIPTPEGATGADFRFLLPKPETVRVSVYDYNGRRLDTLLDESRNAGEHYLHWNAAGDRSGPYFITFRAGRYAVTKKILL